MDPNEPTSSTANADQFKTTHWNLVISSKQAESDVRRKSLEELCEIYWYPLFAYLRRKGHSPEHAADYVQGFFLKLIEKSFLDVVEEEKGRFRWFLMSAIKRYVANEKKRDAAIKRGGDRVLFSLNLDDAEQRYQLEPDAGWTAEQLFDRRWALSILDQALTELERIQADKNKTKLYLALQPTLSGVQMSGEKYAEIATEFGMSTGAVKVAALRLREKYRSLLIDLVRHTVSDPNIVDSELEELLEALVGG